MKKQAVSLKEFFSAVLLGTYPQEASQALASGAVADAPALLQSSAVRQTSFPMTQAESKEIEGMEGLIFNVDYVNRIGGNKFVNLKL